MANEGNNGVRVFTLIIFSLLVLSSAVLAGATIKPGSLIASSDGNDVVIQWATSEENLMQSFVVQRLAGGQTDWVSLDPSVAPKGSNWSYSFTDQTAFKTTTSVYRYQNNDRCSGWNCVVQYFDSLAQCLEREENMGELESNVSLIDFIFC